jgi:hypothetical protein
MISAKLQAANNTGTVLQDSVIGTSRTSVETVRKRVNPLKNLSFKSSFASTSSPAANTSPLLSVSTDIPISAAIKDDSGSDVPASPVLPIITPNNHINQMSNFVRRRAASGPSAVFADALEYKCFRVDSPMSTTNLIKACKDLEIEFLLLCGRQAYESYAANDDTAHLVTVVYDDPWLSGPWETIRSRRDIVCEKKNVFLPHPATPPSQIFDTSTVSQSRQPKLFSEVQRGRFKVARCSTEKTFQVLANPEHLRHIGDDAFRDSFLVSRFDDSRCSFLTYCYLMD